MREGTIGRASVVAISIFVAWQVLQCGCSPVRLWAPLNPPALSSAAQEGQLAPQPDPGRKPHWETRWDAACEQAASSDRLILLSFTGSDWCHWCERLRAEVFERPEFVQWADQRVVLLQADFPRHRELPAEEAAEAERLARNWQAWIKGYPTVLILAPDGTVRARLGYVSGGTAAWIRAAEKQMAAGNPPSIPQP